MPESVISVGTAGEGVRWPRTPREALAGAVLAWAVAVVVISIMVAAQPLKRTVTPLYHEAAANWWARHDLYSGPRGMNYLPHFAVLFSPFHFLPLRLAEVLWRLCSASMLCFGLGRLMRALFADRHITPFFWATLVALPISLAALRNGQANAFFGGVTLWSIVALLERRWWLVTGLMALAAAIKPLGVVLPLLAGAVYGPLRWRLPLGLVAVVVFPFLFGPPDYVIAQHQAALANLKACAALTVHRFADLNGVLRTFGTELNPKAGQWVRLVMGVVTLGLWWAGARRLSGPLAGLWLYALAAGYLMLFNPMNEANSYVILAPALAGWVCWFLFGPVPSARWAGWGVAAISWTMSLLPSLLRPLFGNQFALFWYPLMTMVFLGILMWFIWRSVDSEAAPAPALP